MKEKDYAEIKSEYENVKKECAIFQDRVKALESDLCK